MTTGRRSLIPLLTTLALLAAGLSALPGAQAENACLPSGCVASYNCPLSGHRCPGTHWVCVNNDPAAPPECKVELKGYGGWGVCTHVDADTCLYFNQAGDLCVYSSGDIACVPVL